jgi:hypothetical protein
MIEVIAFFIGMIAGAILVLKLQARKIKKFGEALTDLFNEPQEPPETKKEKKQKTYWPEA